jgi:putative SOS response-associated peptidase YedK
MFLIDVASQDEDAPLEGPRYNIAPTQSINCVVQLQDQSRKVVPMRWGLIPSWSDDLSVGNRMINARGETVDTKPSFRQAFARRRCLIPTDGYYEWRKVVDGKQPYLIHRSDNGVMAMAGLWEENSKASSDGTMIRSCAVITTDANATTRAIHDRMPVFVRPMDFDRWLDPNDRDIDRVKAMLRPAQNHLLQCDAVSRRVNSPKYDDLACIETLPSNSLFD